MAGLLGKLMVVVGMDTTGVAKGTKDIEGRISHLDDSVSSGLGRTLGLVGRLAGLVGFAGLGASVAGAAKAGIEFDSRMQQAGISLKTMLGSTEAANKMLADLQQFAAKTPFEFPDLMTGTQRMLAFGFSAQDVLPMLTAVGDASAALGLSGAEGIGRVTTALGQMRAKGKVSAEEMMQLTEVGIPAWDILAKTVGKSTAEVMELSEKGLIPADQAIKALVSGMEERFPGMMEKQSTTFAGLMSTLRDNLGMTFGQVMRPAFEWLSTVALPRVIELVGRFQAAFATGGLAGGLRAVLPPGLAEGLIQVGSAVKLIATHMGELMPVLAGVAAGFAALKIAGLVSSFTGLIGSIGGAASAAGGLGAALTGALGPIGLVAVAIAGLVTAGVLLYQHWDEVKAAAARAWGVIKGAITTAASAVLDFLREWGPLILAAITGPIGLAVLAVAKHWDDIKAGASAAWDDIKAAVTAAAEALKAAVVQTFGALSDALASIWEVIKGAFSAAWNAMKAAWEDAQDWVESIPASIRSAVGDLGSLLVNAGRAAIDGLWRGMKALWEREVSVWLKIGEKIRNAVGNLSSVLWNAGHAVISGLWSGMKAAWEAIAAWLSGLAAKIKALKGPMAADRAMLHEEGRAIIAGLGEGMRREWPSVERTLAGFSAALSGGLSLGPVSYQSRPSGAAASPATAAAGPRTAIGPIYIYASTTEGGAAAGDALVKTLQAQGVAI